MANPTVAAKPSPPVPAGLEAPTPQEKNLAGFMHLGSIAIPFLLPAGVWLWQRNQSAFVARHAWRAFWEALFLQGVLFVGGAVAFVFTLMRLWHHYQNDWQTFSWTEVGIRLLVTWGVLGLIAVINAVVSVRQAMRAFAGHWPGRVKTA